MANIKTIRTWDSAKAELNGKKTKVIGHNTVLVNDGDDEFYVTYHGNRIVTFFKDGTIEYSNAGWPTSTTRNRLNQIGFANVSFFQRKHTQYVHIGTIGDKYWEDGETRELDRWVLIVPGDTINHGKFGN